MKTNNFIIFDFETGGFSPNKNAICSLAMIAIDGETLQDIAEFECFFKPYDLSLLYDEAAEKITGLSQEILEENGSTLKEIKEQLIKFFDIVSQSSVSKSYKPILVGHNPIFDIGFLQQLQKYTGFAFEKFLDSKLDFHGNYVYTLLDTIQFAHLKYATDPYVKGFKLTECVEREGLDVFNAHSALDDVKATKELFKVFVKSLRFTEDQTIENITKFRTFFQF